MERLMSFLRDALLANIWTLLLLWVVFVGFLPVWRILYDLIRINVEYIKYFDLQLSPKEDFTSCYYQNTERNNRIAMKIKTKVGDYVPPRWYSPDLGTCVPFGIDFNLPYETELQQSNHDSEEYLLSWYPKKPSVEEGVSHELKIIVVLPGLGLSAKSVSFDFVFVFVLV
jgi:hypothetical protein